MSNLEFLKKQGYIDKDNCLDTDRATDFYMGRFLEAIGRGKMRAEVFNTIYAFYRAGIEVGMGESAAKKVKP